MDALMLVVVISYSFGSYYCKTYIEGKLKGLFKGNRIGSLSLSYTYTHTHSGR